VLERAAPEGAGVLVANPPYGERIGSPEELARALSQARRRAEEEIRRLDLLFLHRRPAPGEADPPDDPRGARRCGTARSSAGSTSSGSSPAAIVLARPEFFPGRIAAGHPRPVGLEPGHALAGDVDAEGRVFAFLGRGLPGEP